METESPQPYSEVNVEERQRIADARAMLAKAYRTYVTAAALAIVRRIHTGAIVDARTLDHAIQDAVANGPYASDAAARFEAIAFGENRDASARVTGYPTLPDGSLDWKAVASFAIDHDIRISLVELVGARPLARITHGKPHLRVG